MTYPLENSSIRRLAACLVDNNCFLNNFYLEIYLNNIFFYFLKLIFIITHQNNFK